MYDKTMKYISLIFFFAVFSLNARAQQDPYKDIVYMQLDNGMQVYMLNDDKAVNTNIELTVAVGTDIENDKTLGLSHLVEHIVFRDKRIPHRDFVDYIKEEGATYMNGYTARYKTGYSATIESGKSYWIVEMFAQMLFDKEVEAEDLSSEKGAVQTEIGAYQWTDKPFWYLYQLIEKLTPPQPDIYQDDFALAELPKQSARYKQKINNQTFTLSEVMTHYKTYYYPANMILKIVGNFDMPTMKKQVLAHYGSIKREGTAKAIEPIETPELNQKPYRLFVEGSAENAGYLGIKYVLDDYKKYLIVSAYMDNLALRLQQNLRNDLGHTYSIYASSSSRDKARLAYIYFDGLHDEFESNILAVHKAINDDQKDLSNETIDDALREYKKYYTSVEHDSDTLMELINTAQYLNEKFTSTKTSFQLFNSINHEDFRRTLKETFVDKHLYSIIYREYYLFPYDVVVLSLLASIIMLIAYFKLHYLDKMALKTACADRDITMTRRISNRFIGFIYILTIYLFSAFLWAWIKYLILNYMIGNNAFLFGIDVPYSYIWTISDMIISMLLFLCLCRYLFPYFAHLVVTKEGICLIGHRIKTIAKADIAEIKTEKWHIGQSLKSFGNAMLFWKPLLKISLNDGGEIYIRSKQAEHLKEDLEAHLR